MVSDWIWRRRSTYSKQIKEQEWRTVIILGKKDNPYPYIEKCDFYIQPSRYEGKALTVLEAQCWGNR
ncbi:MAG: glycosyltransferase [Faecalibacillus sp.]